MPARSGLNENRFAFEKGRGEKRGKKEKELDLLYRVKYIGREGGEKKKKKKKGRRRKERFKKCGGVL